MGLLGGPLIILLKIWNRTCCKD